MLLEAEASGTQALTAYDIFRNDIDYMPAPPLGD